MSAERRHLIKCYEDFARAGNQLTEAIGRVEDEPSDCSECYPFVSDFDNELCGIREWVGASIERLEKEMADG